MSERPGWDDRFHGNPHDNEKVWGYCAYCKNPIMVGDIYREYEDDAICYREECIREYSRNLFMELSTRETARED